MVGSEMALRPPLKEYDDHKTSVVAALLVPQTPLHSGPVWLAKLQVKVQMYSATLNAVLR